MWERHNEGHEEESEAQQLQPVSPFCIIIYSYTHTHTTHTKVIKGWRCVLSEMFQTIAMFIALSDPHTTTDNSHRGNNVILMLSLCAAI